MDPPIAHLSFNQDFSCLACGTDASLRIFNVDPFGECFELEEEGGASLATMLFSTSLVTLVGGAQARRRLKILNTKKKATICELTFPTAVLSVKLNRKRLVVVLADQIYVYDISCMKLLHTIETSPNDLALCDLSASDDSVLIYPAPGPGPESQGTVVLFDALNIASLNIVKAHKAELAALSLNSQGTLFATASTKGTIVRVFNTFSGAKVGQFRRGSYPAQIQSLVFDSASQLLAVTSDTETIHLFKLVGDDAIPQEDEEEPEDEVEDEEDEEERILPRAATSSTEPQPSTKRHPSITDKLLMNLPRNISSMLEPQRDFASLKVPAAVAQKRNTVGFLNGSKEVVVASTDGSVYVYEVPQKGGECVLMKQYALAS